MEPVKVGNELKLGVSKVPKMTRMCHPEAQTKGPGQRKNRFFDSTSFHSV